MDLHGLMLKEPLWLYRTSLKNKGKSYDFREDAENSVGIFSHGIMALISVLDCR